MDAAFFTLLGALGGVAITQVSNYFLEDKKSKNAIRLKHLELEREHQNQLSTVQRDCYANFLKSVDLHRAGDVKALEEIIQYFYKASLVSSHETSTHITNVFELVRQRSLGEEISSDDLRTAKAKLVASMRKDAT